MSRAKILDIIYKGLKSIKRDVAFPASEGMALWSTGGVLDSIQLVQFILELEALLEEAFNKKIILISDQALSRTKSPFLSVRNLVDFILESLSDE